MNDTTVIGAAGQVEDVRAYVQAVRAWLGDLPPDEVEDLTAGMEADLAERAAESGGPLGGLLGEPEAYAAELRSAAGLPPRVDVVVPDAVRAEPWTGRLAREAHEVVARHPWLRELRPTWWLARGAVAGWVVAEVLGTGRVVLLPLLGAALSMWLGLVLRRREPLGTGPRVALGAGNALAVVLLLPMLAFYTAGSGDFTDVSGPALPPAGISADGGQITNVFAYDAAGRRLTDVRLYDQYGHPLAVSPDAVPMPGGPDGQGPDPASWPPDPRVMSVFPLRLSATGDPWTSTEGEWAPPVVIAPLAATATSSATPSPSASGSPSAGPASSASPSPSVSSTP
jgi:hypothetical protein